MIKTDIVKKISESTKGDIKGMSSMRGIDTPVRKVRRRVFKEVANLAYHSQNLKDDMEALPYKIVDYEEPKYWESVYRDRAIIRERIPSCNGNESAAGKQGASGASDTGA